MSVWNFYTSISVVVVTENETGSAPTAVSVRVRDMSVTGRLHGTIVGPTGRSEWSVRLVGPTIVSCKRFVRPVGQTVGRIKHA